MPRNQIHIQGAGRREPDVWSSLEQRADPEAFRRRVEAEFPALAPILGEASRRDVLRLMGASLALAGLTGCDIQPEEAAIPHVEAPELEVPGKPRFYATATLLNGYAIPVLVETHEGRPTKVEGNPDHPMTRGTTDAFAQAAVLGLYDPDRSQAVTHDGRIAGWDACQLALIDRARDLEARRGEGLAILTGTVTSPTLSRQIEGLRRGFPQMRWYVHEPAGLQRRHEATRLAFGRHQDVHYRLDEAQVVLSLDGDFLGPGPAQLAHARQWIEGRRRRMGGDAARLHVLESTPSLTGAKAERLPASSSEIGNFTLALAQQLGLGGPVGIELPLAQRARLLNVTEELQRAGDRALVVTGEHLPADVQAQGFAINQKLGALGRTIAVSDPVAAAIETEANALAALAEQIRAGAVDTLIILDANPVYTAPADLQFADALQTVPVRVHVGSYQDQTAALCHWHVPLAHPFETWTDARAVDGHATVVQPLIRPIRGGRSMHEVLATVAGQPQATAYEIVQATWRGLLDGDFDSAWTRVLHDGFAPGTAAVPQSARVGELAMPEPEAPSPLEAVIRPDPCVWDGRFANNAWLQELPKPFTKLTWDNVAAISPKLAAERRLSNGDLVDIAAGERRVRAAAWVLPGQAERTVTLTLGYGQERLGRVGQSIGYDAYPLRTAAEPWTVPDIVLEAVGQAASLASTQDQGGLAGHDRIIREITTEELSSGHAVEERAAAQPSLYPEWTYDSYAWGMAIDLDACIGCNACVVACVAENSIPVVGKEQIALGREMHWLKVDRYYSGPPEQPETHWQPRPCMHCENAPCEVGCPVNATVHGPEGLNQMIYNRCVGTRTCASYCPYKVRRFNFYHYAELEDAARTPQRNPDVTVRARGVMEKCTYCVQRISAARIEAKKEGRKIQDGEVVTACQQACPTRAITFGDVNDLDSAVSKAKAGPRNYALLGELNTRPRTTYLAEVRPAEPSSDEEP